MVELKMFRFSLGVTRVDRNKNKYLRGPALIEQFGGKVRGAKLRWFGHEQRRAGGRMLNMKLPVRGKRGRAP